MSLIKQIKHDCYWYNWGGNVKKGFPSYPTSCGSRCQFFDKFFEINENDKTKLIPNCFECDNYEHEEKLGKNFDRYA